VKGLQVVACLGCALLPCAALAGDADRRSDAGGRPAPQAQVQAQAAAPASEEDREVIENLDLLQAMETAGDLDLLLEMSRKDAD